MLKLILKLIKTAIFAALILVLGNLVPWNGKTLSEHVQSGIRQARILSAGILGDAEKGNRKAQVALDESRAMLERFAAGEREKIEGLMNELKRAQQKRSAELEETAESEPARKPSAGRQ